MISLQQKIERILELCLIISEIQLYFVCLELDIHGKVGPFKEKKNKALKAYLLQLIK